MSIPAKLLQCVHNCCSEAFKAERQDHNLPDFSLCSFLTVVALIFLELLMFFWSLDDLALACLWTSDSLWPAWNPLRGASRESRLNIKGDHAVAVRAYEQASSTAALQLRPFHHLWCLFFLHPRCLVWSQNFAFVIPESICLLRHLG